MPRKRVSAKREARQITEGGHAQVEQDEIELGPLGEGQNLRAAGGFTPGKEEWIAAYINA